MPGKRNHRGFGHLRKLPSKRWQASYVGPDLARHTGPTTFTTKIDAEAWLATQQAAIAADTWSLRSLPRPAAQAAPDDPATFGAYAESWLAQRPLKPRTAHHYRQLLDRSILPTFGAGTLDAVTPAAVRAWYARLPASTPTLRAHTYALLRTIMVSAVAEDFIVTNPCRIRGAGQSKRAGKTEPATAAEVVALADAMPEKYRAMILLTAWCGLRFGEVTALRGRDVDLGRGVVKVRFGVVHINGQAPIVGTPKSDAGVRDVAVPPHLLPMLRRHVERQHVGRDDLLFPGARDRTQHLTSTALYSVFHPARDSIGRPDLRFHDLRHTGAVLAASTGATLAELMARLGHSTPGAAMRYQHAAKGRDGEIAAALSELARR